VVCVAVVCVVVVSHSGDEHMLAEYHNANSRR
jgi:hypothetical protein